MSRGQRAFPWGRVALAGWWVSAAAATLGALRGRPPGAAIVAALLVGLVAILTLGIFYAQLGLFARPITGAAPADAGATLALTFDDGPDPAATRAVLDLLDRGGHRATFFVIGARAEREPALLSEIVARGHALANHSFAHRHSTPFLPPRTLAAELHRAEAVLARARGEGAPAGRWFRAPVGIISPRVARAASLAGLELVSWTATARDGTRRATVEGAVERLRRHLRPGAILVLHDGAERGDRTPIAAAVLARLLDELTGRGLRSVTLDELLA